MIEQKHHPLMEVRQLSLSFLQYGKGLREMRTQAITNFDMTIHRGEIVAVVGASGSGKSLLANAILGILPKNAELGGKLYFESEELTAEKQIRLRGKDIFLIPQSVNALDPLMKTGKQVEVVIKNKNRKSIRRNIFESLGLPPKTENLYPFELSGGMARRVLVSMAMASEAKLIIADEPTPGLDSEARNETLTLIKHLSNSGKGVMFITHDLDAAQSIADKVAVFYAGQTLEVADAKDFSGNGKSLRHPYSRALWNALPQNSFLPTSEVQQFTGQSPTGCLYRSHCPLSTDLCAQQQPEARMVDGGMVRCFHA
ncbi:ABC transporter ATP-binding protein [Sporosarcina aquimarina]|uniref:Nickel import system ATP-binding protein NikD n=1 Tax=Sporosarcina aquimarina TaxID=114975 RepID=A0ABU4FUM3_9BACL|nr:ABC transporter ATP-binding protein [Sporosarcina aquimarina]MDW0108436.1 ABC transporter ATP-binding protein [Sporosarcina aquimarina]